MLKSTLNVKVKSKRDWVMYVAQMDNLLNIHFSYTW